MPQICRDTVELPPKLAQKMRWLHRQQDTGAGVALNQKTPAATGSALALDDDNKGGAGHDGLFASGGNAISSASSC